MAEKLYKLRCESCAYTRFSDGTDIQDMTAVARPPIQMGVPRIDPLTKKVVEPKKYQPPKKFKCPQCGRLITPKIVKQEKPPDEQIVDDADQREAGPEGSQI